MPDFHLQIVEFPYIFAALYFAFSIQKKLIMKQEITVIIVDDDIMSIKRLSNDLAAFSGVKVIATSTAPEKAIKIIIHEQPDLLFLDVEMPGMSGLELLKRMQPDLHPEIKVVFYTAYNKYLLEALRVSAFDYLLKPYTPDELEVIIERYRSYIPQNLQTLEHSLHKLLINKNIFAIQTLTGLMLVNNEKIILFQYAKEQRYWQLIHTDDSARFHRLRGNTSSKDLLAISNSFIQISQDCIVNLNYLASIENRTLQCGFYPPYQHIERTATQRYFKKIKERLEIF